MRTWLLFGVGICIAAAVMTLLERPPPRAARPLDIDFGEAATAGAPRVAPAAIDSAGDGVPEPEPAPAQAALEPAAPGAASPLVVARIVDRARREPAAALAEAMSLEPPELRESALRALFAAWSPEYPAAAAAYLDALPTYAARVAAAGLFARAYAERDPFATLAWLRTLTPPVTEYEKALLAAIEAIPPARAIEIVRETAGTDEERAAAVSRLVAIALEIDARRVRELADEALALPQTESAQQILAVLVGDWAAVNAVGALEWLVERADALGPSVFMQAGFRIGARDPNAGAGYADRVPLALRNAWIGAVALGYANVNPFDAANWIQRYQGDAAYPDAAAGVAEPLALFDGPAGAALLEGIDPALPRYVNAAAAVAGHWARQDAPAAAAWAERLRNEARSGALVAVAREWLVDDEERALEWVLKLPRGTTRDRVLGPLLSGNDRPTERDNRLSFAFSNTMARARAFDEAREALRKNQERERMLERMQLGR